MKAIIVDYGHDSTTFDQLYEGSAFTWEGLSLPNEAEAESIADFLKEQGFVADGVDTVEFFRASGADMNRKYGLTGTNAYQDGLTIVSIPLDQLDVMKMLPIQLRFGARWFDDIVDNNARREEER